MKRITLSLSLFFASIGAFAQCPPGDFALNTQAQVNQFAVDYPNCTSISGFLQIGNPIQLSPGDITDLSPLGNITSVSGNLFIQNNAYLQNVDGLHIETVGGWLYVGGENATNANLQLTNLDGLSSLTSVAQDIYITYNPMLTDISALQNTTFAPYDGYGLTIRDNPALSVCNLPNFCSYLSNPAGAYPRSISGNLAECINVQAVAEACGITLCPTGYVALTTQAQVNQFAIDYPYCTEIAGALQIGPNPNSTLSDITDLSALQNITSVGALFVQFNGLLQNIDALSSITTVNGALVVGMNSALTNVNGLSGITSIGSFFSIDGNAVLTDISGIANINEDTIPELYIQNNPLLQVCNLPNVCEYLQSTKPRNIANNLAECVNEAAVVAACAAMGVDGFDIDVVTMYPNPVVDMLNLSSAYEIKNVTVLNMLGQTVLNKAIGSGDAQVDMSALPAGNYFVRADVEGTLKTIKVVKQ